MRQKVFWVTTDTHFGHRKLDEYRVPNFEEDILRNLNQVVMSGDVLIHLGDMSFYEHAYWHSRLIGVENYRRWLLRGNHDSMSNGWYIDHGWDMVADQLILDIFGKRVLFSHEPQPKADNFDINIHGHLHRGLHREFTPEPHHLLVSIDDELKPFNLRALLDEHHRRTHHVQ